MNKYYKKISSFLIQNGCINKDFKELYEYAIKIIINSIVNIIITVLIGLILGMLKECVCLYLTFFILRKFTGGWHFNKYSFCLISSVILITLVLLFIKHFIIFFNPISFLIILILTSFLIACFAPVDNKNKQLSLKERKIYKILSIIITLLVLSSVIVCLHNELFSLAYSMGLAMILTTVLLVAGKVRRLFELNRT